MDGHNIDDSTETSDIHPRDLDEKIILHNLQHGHGGWLLYFWGT